MSQILCQQVKFVLVVLPKHPIVFSVSPVFRDFVVYIFSLVCRTVQSTITCCFCWWEHAKYKGDKVCGIRFVELL